MVWAIDIESSEVPQDEQKRLSSEFSVVQDGHFIMACDRIVYGPVRPLECDSPPHTRRARNQNPAAT
jgi:hypothetical protein